MEGLPLSYGQIQAATELERVIRREFNVPFKGRARRCFACRRAWCDAEAGIPAVVYERVDGMHVWNCRCCGGHRTLRADGRVESCEENRR
jgi:hypothetical protein